MTDVPTARPLLQHRLSIGLRYQPLYQERPPIKRKPIGTWKARTRRDATEAVGGGAAQPRDTAPPVDNYPRPCGESAIRAALDIFYGSDRGCAPAVFRCVCVCVGAVANISMRNANQNDTHPPARRSGEIAVASPIVHAATVADDELGSLDTPPG